VHDVEPAGAGIGEGAGLRGGVRAVTGLAIGLALREANHLATAQVNRGIEFHRARGGDQSASSGAGAGAPPRCSNVASNWRWASKAGRSDGASGSPASSLIERGSRATPLTRNS